VGGVWSSGKILKPYQKARLTSFINPGNDPRGAGYQVLQSEIAVGSGGDLGQGPGERDPDAGLFSAHSLYGLHLCRVQRGARLCGRVFCPAAILPYIDAFDSNAQTAADLPGSLIIMGIVAVLTFQIAVNVGMVIGLMPVTGIPLPLMSYGGSSVLFTFLALGVAMNVRMRRFVN
jgi:rod shape determining protein RodA